MKKLLSSLVLCLMVSACAIGTAQAITVDGSAGANEWDNYMIYGTDVNETGGPGVGIDDRYDISAAYAYWDNTNVYFRADTYGIPTLARLDSGNFQPAYYQWTIDTNKDRFWRFDINLQHK
ncbi:MAG: hypothetical protein COS99_02860 [Candidatus Omnitrophica bacterium CG07_land_8_20_14_0_80_42_15]|uniref:Lipoprotein n=1 Tax=Candidatus Aquitaenariimonas noxiae TaxID=1974741 RepID=A0A2J0KX78_9BACT|nr:MAG: hypothetical protein COS99_02860 [Candidatus Omnitrophica bacterium CG07_land_8_20_14_0_80_42_15]